MANSKSSFLSIKKILLLGFLFITLLIIPLTIYLVQQQQDSRSQATPSTVLTFNPNEKTTSVGEKISFDIMLAPGNNQVNFVKLAIKFDPTKLTTSAEDFTVNTASNLTIQEGPVVENGTFLVALTIGSDPTKIIQTNTKIGTISFDALGASELPTQISFDQNLTEIRSINGENNDAFNENVLLRGEPANVTILTSGQTVSVTPTPNQNLSGSPTPITATNATVTPTQTRNATPTPTQTIVTSSSANEEPICSSLTLDRSASGNAPYSITFTVKGTDVNGTISKAIFNFGESNTQTINTGGGLGSSSINVPLSHTFYNEGEYTVSVILTDNQGATSDSLNCTTTVSITENDLADTSDYDSNNSSLSASLSQVPPTGPDDRVVGVGILGGLLFLIGTLLFLAL